MSKVYVIHEPMRRNRQTGEMAAVFDLSPAGQFGELVYVLPSHTRPALDPESVLPQIREVMAGYTADDYIVAVGDPALYCWATALATRATGGIVKLLKWDGRDQVYYPTKAQVYG